MESGDLKIVMKPGDALLIPPYTKHRFTGLEDSEIIEFSSHHEESDSYRDDVSGPVSVSEPIAPRDL